MNLRTRLERLEQAARQPRRQTVAPQIRTNLPACLAMFERFAADIPADQRMIAEFERATACLEAMSYGH